MATETIKAMKLSPDRQLLVALQNTVSTVLKQWLDDNKGDLLRVVREAVLESEAVKHERQRQQTKLTEFLTVAEVAQRWQLNPESVRRMIRQGRLPRDTIGRQNRIALSSVEEFEKSGAVPSRR
jgi:excisionase family DNA binding protein